MRGRRHRDGNATVNHQRANSVSTTVCTDGIGGCDGQVILIETGVRSTASCTSAHSSEACAVVDLSGSGSGVESQVSCTWASWPFRRCAYWNLYCRCAADDDITRERRASRRGKAKVGSSNATNSGNVYISVICAIPNAQSIVAGVCVELVGKRRCWICCATLVRGNRR